MGNVSAVVPPSWRKSSFSDANDCIEVRIADHVVQVRHSRRPTDPILEFEITAWRAFLAGITAGEFASPG